MADITVSADIHSFMQAANAAAARAVLSAAALGANTFTAAQFVDGNTDAVQLTIQGHSTQTNNILLIEKSDGTDLLTVSNAGKITCLAAANSLGITIGASGSGFGVNAAGDIDFWSGGGAYMTFYGAWLAMASGVQIGWSSSATGGNYSPDAFFKRKGAASIQLGADAAGVTNQTLTAASRITSDGVGANLTLSGGNGLGAAGGDLIFSSYTTGAAATAGVLTARWKLDAASGALIPQTASTYDLGTNALPVGVLYVGTVAIGGNNVLGSQGAVVADASNGDSGAGGDTVDKTALDAVLSSHATAINTLLARLRTHGLIAT